MYLRFLSNNKATSDPSRKYPLSCKDKMKQAEENRSSGKLLHLYISGYMFRCLVEFILLNSQMYKDRNINQQT